MLATITFERRALIALWSTFSIVGFLLLDFFAGAEYALAVVLSGAVALVFAVVLARAGGRPVKWLRRRVVIADLAAITALYVIVVVGFRLAFTVFGDNTLLLVAAFWAALLVGVVGPIWYTVWQRHRPLSSLGLGVGRWRLTLGLALVLGTVQFALTLARVEYPAPEVWLPLLAMALVVGFFEAIFFRGFIQNRLEASFGPLPAVAVAAGLYGLYHIGYGMGMSELIFLAGLGVVYGVAFRLAGSILVLWPLLTPLGSLFNQLESTDLVLPLESVIGFVDVLLVMLVAVWFARRHQHGWPERMRHERVSRAPCRTDGRRRRPARA
jgi:uncharacterized protein